MVSCFASNFFWEDQKNQFFCLIQTQSVDIYGNMKFYILLWLSSLAYGLPQVDISTAMKSKRECRVIEKSSGESKPCIGAFVFQDQTYYGCTTVGSENGEAWCSTKVDPLTYEHITDGDFFGYCKDTKCVTAEKGQKEQNNLIALQQGNSKQDFFICKCQKNNAHSI